jgi:adenylate kinase family enzyme
MQKKWTRIILIGFCEMKKIIHILGASGSGTTTLGKAIGKKWMHTLLDSDDYFWVPTNPMYAMTRGIPERQRLLAEDIRKCERCVITGSLCGWGDIFIPMFELVIFIDTPKNIRIERLKVRERMQFGDRILPGGDMHQNHIEFLDWARRYDTAGIKQRSRSLHMDWLKQIICPIEIVDGSQPIGDILDQLAEIIEN